MILLVGLNLWRQLSKTDENAGWFDTSSVGHGVVTDLGQHQINSQLVDTPTGLTSEELEWGYELGATTIDEVIDLVRKHKASKQ